MTAHVPVLADVLLAELRLDPGAVALDGTLGGGGHAQLLLDAVGPDGRVVALDRDIGAVEAGRIRFAGRPVDVVHANFDAMRGVLDSLNRSAVDAIVLDVGLSSDQLADASRGFSYESTGELDLRFDTSVGEPAWRRLERMPERELADLIFALGEERYSRRIARTIVEERRRAPIRTADHLARLVRRSVRRTPGLKIDPATRTFQALRIAVNDELGALERALRAAPDCLKPGGRIAVISFHSLEDRIVKNAFRQDPRYNVLTKKPIRPIEAESRRNPRSRSARLRIARHHVGTTESAAGR
ncbi:MAG: 16S rRNA (cytosine(1402)-N(4))-methyltransferase RsmH [Planctomycetes bacterium]|nr:16S rRNA (cytosine(1402)-N(4))-methyltransferase RsmH [Planctomycetota bacterium]